MELRGCIVKEPVICHICDFQPEYGGAFVDSLLSLNRYCLSHLKIKTVYIFPEKANNRAWLQRFDNEKVEYGFVPRRRNILSYVHLVLKDHNPVILHTHFFLYDLSAILIKLLLYRHVRVVWHYHSPSNLTVQQRLKDVIKLRLIFGSFGDRCIAVGDGIFRSLQHSGMSKEKAVLIHNGVDTGRFIPNGLIRTKARQSLKAPQDSIIFLLLGYAPHIKGVDIFIKAAAEAIGRDDSPKLFVVVGRRETRDFISHLPFASKLGNTLLVIDPVEDLSVLLNGVDVMVSASRSEGFGYAVIEAMAAEKLVLCSDIDPVRQTYGQSKGVWLYPSEDWKMLADLMEQAVFMRSDERQSLGRANNRYVIENHSLDHWSEKVGQLYKSLIEKRK
jgi:glycosyltransferase involved in cell wall biosynthesis